jgi:SAM-dependent methyltransferase
MKEHFSNSYIDEINSGLEDNYFTPIIERTFNDQNISSVCDVGCGNGVFTAGIKKYKDVVKLTGVDSNQHALEEALKIGFDSLVHVHDFSNDVLPIDSESFDLVVCKDVLEHLVNPNHLMDEINRILKPGGVLLLHVPNHFTLYRRIVFLFNNKIDTFSWFGESDRFDFPHIRFFTLSSVLRLLNLTHFTFLNNLSYFFVNLPIVHQRAPLFFRKILSNISTDNFCDGVTILAKKK